MANKEDRIPAIRDSALKRRTVRDEETASLETPVDFRQIGHACEVCGRPLAEIGHLLCVDCSRALTFVLELLRESAPLIQSRLEAHPELTADDLDRVREVFNGAAARSGSETATASRRCDSRVKGRADTSLSAWKWPAS